MCLKYLTEVCTAWKDPEFAIFYLALALFLQLITPLWKDKQSEYLARPTLYEAGKCHDLWDASFIFSLLNAYHEFKVEGLE